MTYRDTATRAAYLHIGAFALTLAACIAVLIVTGA